MLLTTLGMAALLAAPLAQDTTIAVSTGTRLHVSTFAGEIRVHVWDRSEVRVRADDSDDGRISIQRAGSTLRIKPQGRYGHRATDFVVTVPRWLAMEVSGTNTDISVEGTEAAVSAATVNGDIVVRGGRGTVTASTVQGDVAIAGARDRITVTTVDGDIRVTDVTGELRAQSVDGSIDLIRMKVTSLDVNTVDGDIRFEGPILAGGQYTLATHDGDVIVVVAGDVDATFSVSTFDGDFVSDFPITAQGLARGEQLSFTIGAGRARVRLEAFDGTIRLSRGR